MNRRNDASTYFETLSLTPIAHIHSDFPEKFGIPRQSGMAEVSSFLLFEKEYRSPDCIRDLEQFSHLWLLWGFSANEAGRWSPTVRPPRLGGNKHTGVFASRSPFRPNPVGLSSVRLDKIEYGADGPALFLSGADLMDGTPVYDIKPYLPFTDCHPDASASFTADALKHRLQVHCEPSLLSLIPEEKREALLSALALDPRPAYHSDPDRQYGMSFSSYTVRFFVKDNNLYVSEICKRI